MTSTTDPGRRSPDEIEREIDDERDRLTDTADELQDRLAPGAMAEEAMYRTRAHGGDLARGFGDAIRENPIPLALIGVGLAWLMTGGQGAAGRRRSLAEEHHEFDDSLYDDEWLPDEGAYGSMSEYGGPRGRNLRAARPGPSGIPRGGVDWDESERGSAGEWLGETARSARDAAAGAAGHLRGRGRGAGGAFSEAGESAYWQARHYGRDAAGTLDDMVEEQPLVVGALAMAAGAAIGSLLPNTRAENEAMGEHAERLRAEAADAAAEEGAKARRVAETAAEEAARSADETAHEARSRTGSGREMVEKAEEKTREAAERVSGAAEEEARRQDLGRSVDPKRD